VSRVFRDGVLEGFDGGAVEEAEDGGDDLEVVLEHAVAVDDGANGAVELGGDVEGVSGAGVEVGAEA